MTRPARAEGGGQRRSGAAQWVGGAEQPCPALARAAAASELLDAPPAAHLAQAQRLARLQLGAQPRLGARDELLCLGALVDCNQGADIMSTMSAAMAVHRRAARGAGWLRNVLQLAAELGGAPATPMTVGASKPS